MIYMALRFDDPSSTSDRVLEKGIFEAVEAACSGPKKKPWTPPSPS